MNKKEAGEDKIELPASLQPLQGTRNKISSYRKLFLVLAVLIFGLSALEVSKQELRYWKSGKVTNAHVERLWNERKVGRKGRKIFKYYVDYSFLDESAGARVGVGGVEREYWERLVVGGDVPVQYLPGKGEARVYINSMGANTKVLLAALPALILYGKFLFNKRRRRQNLYRDLVSSGVKVSGKVIKITGNNKWSPIRIEYEFMDSISCVHNSRTIDLPTVVAENYKIGDSLKVFYDPQNPKRNISEIG